MRQNAPQPRGQSGQGKQSQGSKQWRGTLPRRARPDLIDQQNRDDTPPDDRNGLIEESRRWRQVVGEQRRQAGGANEGEPQGKVMHSLEGRAIGLHVLAGAAWMLVEQRMAGDPNSRPRRQRHGRRREQGCRKSGAEALCRWVVPSHRRKRTCLSSWARDGIYQLG